MPYLPAGGYACNSVDESTCMTYAPTPLLRATSDQSLRSHLSCASFQSLPEA